MMVANNDDTSFTIISKKSISCKPLRNLWNRPAAVMFYGPISNSRQPDLYPSV